jgi:hypothetical protein
MASRINPIGICAHLGALSSTDLNKQLDLMQQAGINWIRFDMFWGTVEPTQGNWTFAKYDPIVSGILSRGMQAIAILEQYWAPAWYRGTAPWNQPPAPQDYAMFAQTVAAHYKGQILLYEIGNEPNMNGNWYPQANASAYTALLQAAYPVIKSADPNAKVISAGLSPTGITPETFLTQMYASGAQGYMDYVGYHPYSWPNGPDYTGSGATFSELSNLYSIMQNNGDGNKQIMATEVGWPTYSGGVTEANQAAYIQRVYQKIMHEDYQYVALACVYDFLDDGTDPNNPEHHFGLLRTDYSQKPAYSAMQSARNDYNANFTPINP